MYKSPKYPRRKFIETLERLIQEVGENSVFLGDFNINMQKSEGNRVIELFRRNHYQSKLHFEHSSTDGGSHIDICFSNIPHLQAWFYECYYSYHKPICVVWKK
jgi:hypothetical protein